MNKFEKDNLDKAVKPPLIVDLDGTFIRSDMLEEMAVRHVSRHPVAGVFKMARWASKGKANLKSKLEEAELSSIEVANVPKTELEKSEVFSSYEHRYIASGSPQEVVDEFCTTYPEEFKGGFGSSDSFNLVGDNKAKSISEKYPDGFDYVGNSKKDIPIWKSANNAYAANISNSAAQEARKQGVDLQVLSTKPSFFPYLIKEMRLHQWAKNLLIFIPAFLTIGSFQPWWIIYLIIGFLAFGLVSSSTYILNDLLDIEADRQHEVKKNRPIASGNLNISTAMFSMVGLWVTGMLLALFAGGVFACLLFTYFIISLAYSFKLKKEPLVDVMTLSGLFCLRTLAGAAIIAAIPNIWFMLSLYFFFLSLAIAKRDIEISKKGPGKVVAGRGYVYDDRMIVTIFGVVAAFSSSIIVTIYLLLSRSTIIHSDLSAALVIILLIYWLMRFWFLTWRDKVNYDPVIFAIRDRVSVVTLGMIGLIVIFEQLRVMG